MVTGEELDEIRWVSSIGIQTLTRSGEMGVGSDANGNSLVLRTIFICKHCNAIKQLGPHNKEYAQRNNWIVTDPYSSKGQLKTADEISTVQYELLSNELQNVSP